VRRAGLRQVGGHKRALSAWHAWCRTAVAERVRLLGGRCEAGCGARWGGDWCHLFGRGNIVAEPWCSLPEMTAGLCRTCHRAIDEARAPELRERLRRLALLRLGCRFPRELPLVAEGLMPLTGSAVEFARQCERLLCAKVEPAALPAIAPGWTRS
jgi:hypothetical protein